MSKLTTATGETLHTGDIVRVGKGKANWTVTGTHDAAIDAISLVSDKGARKALDTADTLTIVVRGESGHRADRDRAAATIAARTENTGESTADIRTELAGLTDSIQALADMRPETVTVTRTFSDGADRAETFTRAGNDWVSDSGEIIVASDADAFRAEIARIDGALRPDEINWLSENADAGTDVPDFDYCPVCGEPVDYCPGHGETGDPEGFDIMNRHDSGDHSSCHPAGCDIAQNIEDATDQNAHVDYPHEPGYLIDCDACENGPCVCSVPCNDETCVRTGIHAPGARWFHHSPCVSTECEHPESVAERAAGIARCGAVYTTTHPFTCTLIADGHTAHEDHATDAPDVVRWDDVPADYDPEQTYADAVAYVSEVRPDLIATESAPSVPVEAPAPVRWVQAPPAPQNRAQRRAAAKRENAEKRRAARALGHLFGYR